MSTLNKNSMLVCDVMLPLDRFPVINEQVILKEALEEMGRSRLGVACVVDQSKNLLGILTDGDIRRKLLKIQKPFAALLVDDAIDHAIKSPVTVSPEDTLVEAVSMMGRKQVWDLPVVNGAGELVGLLHLHPAVEALLDASK